MNSKKIISLAALCTIVTIGIVAIVRNNNSEQNNAVQVSASFYPLYEFAKQVGGSKISAVNMTPAGAEPHNFEPSAKALAGAQKADLFIYNGGEFEPWTEKFLTSFSQTTVKANNGISLHDASETEEHEHEDGHHHQEDPHFWLNPVLAQKIVENIRDGLIQTQPQHKAYFTDRAAQYTAKLQNLDHDYKSALANCSQDTVVASHGTLSYLSEQYGFTALSIAGLSPEAEPSARKMAEVAKIVAQKDIHYILFETLVSPRLADTIARETGAKTIVFNPLEGLTDDEQKQGKNYYNVQQENINTLRTALACR